MNPVVELNLGLILFLPWFVVLATLYWLFPRQPRDAARIAFDVGALLVSVLAFLLAIYWSHANADPAFGRIWQQILATAIGYGVFLGVLASAWGTRRAWLRRRLR